MTICVVTIRMHRGKTVYRNIYYLSNVCIFSNFGLFGWRCKTIIHTLITGWMFRSIKLFFLCLSLLLCAY